MNPSQLRLDPVVIYLDECLCNCQEILKVLRDSGVWFERHLDHFKAGTEDADWLPSVGRNKWVLLTADKRVRKRRLEILAIKTYGVRAFIYTSNNLSGKQKADILRIALPSIRSVVESLDPPFVASISQTGKVSILIDKHGSVADRAPLDAGGSQRST